MSNLILSSVLISVVFTAVNCQVNWQPGNWALGCDFRGNDLRGERMRGEQCGGACARTSGCTHFVWTSFNGGTCWMKSGGVSKSQAIANGDFSTTCGIIKEGGGGDSGNTGNNNNNGNTGGSCKFRFGMEYKGERDFSAADYLTQWIGYEDAQYGNQFNPNWHGTFLRTCKRENKTPVWYGYLIAFMSRKEWCLKDCDMEHSQQDKCPPSASTLCRKGADFIRAKGGDIVGTYRNYAKEAANIIGRDGKMIWLLEPDFGQYHHDNRQGNGGLSGGEMRQFFDQIAEAIKSQLPNAEISWDISPWLSEQQQREWWGHFASSPHIKYIHTSGGRTKAGEANIRSGERTWRFMHEMTGKGIIADTGYGVGGGGTGHDYAFDDENNLRNRINDGVIAVTQASARDGWQSTTNHLRNVLPPAKC